MYEYFSLYHSQHMLDHKDDLSLQLITLHNIDRSFILKISIIQFFKHIYHHNHDDFASKGKIERCHIFFIFASRAIHPTLIKSLHDLEQLVSW